MVGEAGPSCQSPPPRARSTSVACRTTPRCRAHAGRGIWPPRVRGPGTTARSKCVRPVAARRAPRKTRALEGACSAVARLQPCEPVCGHPSSSTWTPLSRLSHAAVRARRRHVSPIGSRGRRRQDVAPLHFFALLPALGNDRMNGLLPHWSARSANWLRSVLGRWFSGAISYSSRASLGS